MPTLTDLVWLALMVAMMAFVVAAAIWRTRQIRDGRADPIISPDWSSIERPASPPSAIRWGCGAQPEIEDDHVGRPFPPVTDAPAHSGWTHGLPTDPARVDPRQ